MITNPILEERERVQRQLSEDAGYDLVQYAKNTQRIVREIEEEYGVRFKYGVPTVAGEVCRNDPIR